MMLQSYVASAAEVGGKSNGRMTFPVRLSSNETALVNVSLPAVVNARLRTAADTARGGWARGHRGDFPTLSRGNCG
jgi:hypothetical protein